MTYLVVGWLGECAVLGTGSLRLLTTGKVDRGRVRRRLTYFIGKFPFLRVATSTSIREKVVMVPRRGRTPCVST